MACSLALSRSCGDVFQVISGSERVGSFESESMLGMNSDLEDEVPTRAALV